MPTELCKPKAIENGISFNVAIDTEYGYTYLIGLRVWKGLLMPPATRKGHVYYPCMKGGKDFAAWIYQRLIELKWHEHFNLQLKEKDLCIDPIVMSVQEFTQYFE